MHDANIFRVVAPSRLLVLLIIIHDGLNLARAQLLMSGDVILSAVETAIGLLFGFFVSFVGFGLRLRSKPAEGEDALTLTGHE